MFRSSGKSLTKTKSVHFNQNDSFSMITPLPFIKTLLMTPLKLSVTFVFIEEPLFRKEKSSKIVSNVLTMDGNTKTDWLKIFLVFQGLLTIVDGIGDILKSAKKNKIFNLNGFLKGLDRFILIIFRLIFFRCGFCLFSSQQSCSGLLLFLSFLVAMEYFAQLFLDTSWRVLRLLTRSSWCSIVSLLRIARSLFLFGP